MTAFFVTTPVLLPPTRIPKPSPHPPRLLTPTKSSPSRSTFCMLAPSTSPAPSTSTQRNPSETTATPTLASLAPRALLLLVAAIWGTNFPVVKHVQATGLPPSLCACARFTLASLATLPFVQDIRTYPRHFLLDACTIGTFVFAGYFTQALSLSGPHAHASTSAFCCALAVIVVPILQRSNISLFTATRKQQPLQTVLIPALLALTGVSILEAANGLPFGINDIFALLQAVAFASGFALNERATEKYPHHVAALSAVQLAVIAALSSLWALTDAGSIAISTTLTDLELSACTAYTGFITTALAVWLQNVALKRVRATEMAVLLSTEPLWAAMFAAIMCGEKMGASAVIGAAFILSACISRVFIPSNRVTH
ncbi:putative transporter [Gracilariopsis chorda]|uniref:Putative transporter n=1 Tax=Gracilariopsis chorda TaxID=448386 RepID=A0A2V3IYA7_9FLOR|nr:putative transporter [Gracilariopsis chorda]|eukprot:PXF47124.1 putative transporter [Gracilariopsis chorda]